MENRIGSPNVRWIGLNFDKIDNWFVSLLCAYKHSVNSGQYTTVLQSVVAAAAAKMWVSSMTSAHRLAATARGGGGVGGSGHNNDRASNERAAPAFAWNVLLRVCTAIVLLNTIGLITLVCADTIQYPVTAPFGSVIPPGKSNYFFSVWMKNRRCCDCDSISTCIIIIIIKSNVDKSSQSIDISVLPQFHFESNSAKCTNVRAIAIISAADAPIWYNFISF